jgi:hypothetical protein
MNVFDFDGVVSIGLCPTAFDVIITGRGFDECEIVYNKLQNLLGEPANWPPIYFNMKLKSQGRTREDSGRHKAKTILQLLQSGHQIETIFEDDPQQFAVIAKELDTVFGPMKTASFSPYGTQETIKVTRPNLCFVECPWVSK